MTKQTAAAEVEFGEFAAAQASQLFRIAYLLCGDWHEAQDLVQIALTKLFVAWGRASRVDHVSSYARSVLVNSYLSSRRPRRHLRPMLPANWVVTYVSPSTERGSLEVNFNDGKGAADILLSIWLRGEDYNCPSPLWKDEGPRPAGALPISCVMRDLPDGSTEEDAVTYADVASYYVYMIYEDRPDGLVVSINVGNGTLDGTPHLAREGWPYVDRARPPGTMALWSKIVESPKWHL